MGNEELKTAVNFSDPDFIDDVKRSYFLIFFIFEKYILKLVVTKVGQHALRWDAAAKILLQVVRPVQECLQLLGKQFITVFVLEARWKIRCFSS